ncbi:MAG: hypothetical protein QOJ20_5637 [Mycobacterium sp.]|jgi:hypothetical protein|nr:hypothetical protein [Mycobacterium sp.]
MSISGGRTEEGLRNRLSAVADRLNVIGQSTGGFVVQKYLESRTMLLPAY